MFQWAALVLEDLNASNHLHAENRILELFRTVPESLNDLYERALNNIAVNDRTIAHQILKLLLFASRPLAEPELAFAFALMDDNENYHRHRDIIRSGNLEPIIGRLAKAVCGSFLKFSEEDRLLAVSHESARLFLVNHRMGEDDTLERAIFNVDEGHLILGRYVFNTSYGRKYEPNLAPKKKGVYTLGIPFCTMQSQAGTTILRR